MLNALTIDLEDYFQVHAFSSVVRFEDWDNYESRIERNTHRLLEILKESSIGHRAERIANELTPPAPDLLPLTSNLPPEALNFLPQTSNLKPQTFAKATFFCLGWVAERYPNLIKEIQHRGHEIACHGYSHKLIYTQSRDEFREDVRKAKAILEDITGDEVVGYRAPSYSITNRSRWAFEVLMEEGFKYDSSIFPIHHDFYGFPRAPRFPFVISTNGDCNFKFQISDFKLKQTQSSVSSINSTNPMNPNNPVTPNLTACASRLTSDGTLVEFPLSTVRIFGANLPVAGGGYFRLLPYSLIKKGLRRINDEEKQPFVFYIHPWELDPDQPRLNSVSFRSRFRHYVNLQKTESRFKKLLSDFNFCSIREVLKLNRPNKLNERQRVGTVA